jgi:hypothetical protein
MKLVTTLICAAALTSLVGCSHMNTSEQSALSGSAMGAIGGAALGALTGQAGKGALLGAGLGAVAGSAIGADRERGEAMEYAQRHEHVEYHHYYDKDGNEIIEEEHFID